MHTSIHIYKHMYFFADGTHVQAWMYKSATFTLWCVRSFSNLQSISIFNVIVQLHMEWG